MNGMMDEAMDVLKKMQQRGIKPDEVAYNCMINGYAKKGMMGEALSTLENIHSKGIKPNVVIYNTVVKDTYGRICLVKHGRHWRQCTGTERNLIG